MIHLAVVGHPVTQGSHRAIMPKHASRPIVIEDRGQRHKDWRAAVSHVAADVMAGAALLDGPLAVRLHFRFVKAPSQKRWLPHGRGTGDLDKLCRAVLDSMTGRVFVDDSQVVAMLPTKAWGNPPGVDIFVSEPGEETWSRWALGLPQQQEATG